MAEAIFLLSGVLIGWLARYIIDQPIRDMAALWERHTNKTQYTAGTSQGARGEHDFEGVSSDDYRPMHMRVFEGRKKSSTESARTTR